jgi:anthranilate phosphoribosyltransferase
MPITDTEALTRVIEHREIFHDEMLALMRRIMSGEMSPVMIAACHRAARQEGNGGRDRRRGAGDARVRQPVPGGRPPPPGRHRRHRGRRLAHLQHQHLPASSWPPPPAPAWPSTAGRSVSSKRLGRRAGGAGRRIDLLARGRWPRCLEETGIGFMFAPNHHAAMKHAAPVRKELGVRTIFNILGPLTNPAGAPNQLMGVFHPDLVGIQVRVLQRLGSRARDGGLRHERHGRVVAVGRTLVGELKDGEVREYVVHPSDFGLPVYDSRAAEGGRQGRVGAVRTRAGQRRRPGARRGAAQRRGGAVLPPGVAATWPTA